MPWKFNPFTGKLSEVGTSGNAVATQDIISDGNMSIMTYDGIMKYVNRTTIEPSSGNIITEGNITADSFIGDGSQLTGLTGGAVDRLTNGVNEVILGSTGTLTFPTLTVPISDNANPSGTGQTIKFSDSTQQAIIYGPESTSEATSAQRIIIQGAPGYAGTSGEGGDVYVWAGPGGDADGNGGDIKVRAGVGDGTGSGGYLNFQAGDSATGNGGYINIESGESGTYGSGGDITVHAQSGGEITLRTESSTSTISWLFDTAGDLTAPRNIILNNPVTTVTTTTTGTVADSTANPFTFRILKADNPQLVIPFADPNFVLRWTGSDAGSLAAADQAPNGQGVSSLDSDDGTYWNFDSWFGLNISRPDTGTVFSVDYGVVVSDTTISTTDTNLIIDAYGKQWKFGTDGILTLPNGAVIKDIYGDAVAFGQGAGTTSQGINAVAVGSGAGTTSQGDSAVAIGNVAGTTTQSQYAVAVGYGAGQTTQGQSAVAIGFIAGDTGQGTNAVAVGYGAGTTSQGNSAVAIGKQAGETNQGANSIILNATGAALNQTTTGTFTVKPVRAVSGGSLPAGFKPVAYNPTTGEFVYYDA